MFTDTHAHIFHEYYDDTISSFKIQKNVKKINK